MNARRGRSPRVVALVAITDGTAHSGTSYTTGASQTSIQVTVYGSTWAPPTSTPAIPCVAINNGGNPTGGTCTVTITSTSSWLGHPDAWGVGRPYVYVYVNDTVSTNQNRREVSFHFDDTSTYPGMGVTPTYVGSGYACSSLPIFKAWKGCTTPTIRLALRARRNSARK